MDESELVTRAKRGDDAAFEVIVRRHTDAVWRLARSLVSDDATAEEAVQDTFVKAYRALPTFRGDAAVSTWLHAICARTCLDRRRRRRLESVPLDDAATAAAASGPAPSGVEDRIVLDAAIAQLPDDERIAFTLVSVLGYAHDEAAAIVGSVPSTMRSRLARARTRLVTALQAEENDLR